MSSTSIVPSPTDAKLLESSSTPSTPLHPLPSPRFSTTSSFDKFEKQEQIKTTINDLPPEILIRIAVLGCNVRASGRIAYECSEQPRRDFLRNFSLVCHKWQYPGESTMWKSIWMDSKKQIKAFCESGATQAGELVTSDVNSYADFPAESLKRLLTHCKGITSMRIAPGEGGGFDPRVLESEALLGLKCLRLDGINYAPLEGTHPLGIKFALDRLNIDLFAASPQTGLLDALLQPSLSSAFFNTYNHQRNLLELLPSSIF